MKYITSLFVFLFAFNAWAGYSPSTIITDPAGVNQAIVTSSTPLSGDEAVACILHPNSASIGVTGTFWQTTQPVSAASLPLPTGAATAANQSTIITALGSPFQAGGSIGNTSFGISGTLPAFAAIPTFKIDQTTPGTTNGVQINAALPVGANVIGKVSIDQTTPGTTNLVQIGGSLPAGSNTIGTVKAIPVGNANAAFSQTSVSTAQTISAPANAVRVLIQADPTNTDCIRYRFDGTAATSTVGMVLYTAQDTGQLDTGLGVSVVACSGTQKVNVQYFAQ